MHDTRTGPNGAFSLDKRAVRRAFDRAADDYDEAAVLQHEVGRRMLERLELLRHRPRAIVDIGTGSGNLTRQLAQRCPDARLTAVDLAPRMLQRARAGQGLLQRWRGRTAYLCADAEALPLTRQCSDMVFSNLMLQWCNDLDRAFAEMHRILRPGGVLMFSTFGPDTLRELRHCWRTVDGHNHVNAFIDMHDIGDALVRAGFAEPVMDMEYFTLTYPELRKLMLDLKTIGAHNVTRGRPRGLTGRTRWQQLRDNYERLRGEDGLLPATYEVIYGHAWQADVPSQRRARDGAVQVPIERLTEK